MDTDGEPMRAGMRAQPAVVAPNVAEAEEAVGHEFTDAEDLCSGLAGLIDMGAEEAIITTGSGCVAVVGAAPARRSFEASIEPLATVASVGSGDAFLAGYVKSRRAGVEASSCLAYGVACGAESTQHLGAGMLSPSEVARLVDRVSVRRMEVPRRRALIGRRAYASPLSPHFPCAGRAKAAGGCTYNRRSPRS